MNNKKVRILKKLVDNMDANILVQVRNRYGNNTIKYDSKLLFKKVKDMYKNNELIIN